MSPAPPTDGDKALANIELAFARLPRLESREDAFRLFLAEALLEEEHTPRSLMRALGLDPDANAFRKHYDPDEPRVPAGSGRTSGEWTSGGSTQAAMNSETNPAEQPGKSPPLTPAIMAIPEAGTLAEGLFTGEATPFLEALGVLGARIGGAGAVLGAIFVPAPNSVTSEGEIPGDPSLHYVLDNDTGILRLFQRGDTSDTLPIVGARGRDGIFFEVETGIPIARFVGGSLVFDADALAEEEDASAGVVLPADPAREEPRLCPDPGPDAPHGASDRAAAYQAYISALNNPQRPLPPGMAVSLTNPQTGKRVVYDDCRETNGAMIEAKAEGFARLLRDSHLQDVLTRRWSRQAMRQVDAATWRDVDWFFAEDEAKDFASRLFSKEEKLKKIHVYHEPAPGGAR